MKSLGCGKTPTLKNSPGTVPMYNQITSGGGSRTYVLRYPSNYDNTKAYRLVIAYHWYGADGASLLDCSDDATNCSAGQEPFYGLWAPASDSAIFVGPNGLSAAWANTNGADLTFTDDLLTQVEGDLCIDTSRVFVIGYSQGAGFAYVLACQRPTVFRAVAVLSGGVLSNGCDGVKMPIALYGSHGTNDNALPITSGKQIRDNIVKANGCTAITPEPMPADHGHVCVSYSGCSPGHPVRWCPFQGGNPLSGTDGGQGATPFPLDEGSTMSWNPQEIWKFLMQF